MSIGAPHWLRSYDLDSDLLNSIQNILSGADRKSPRHVYVLASQNLAAKLRGIFVPTEDDIFDDSDCYEEFFITAADFARRLETLTENLAAAEKLSLRRRNDTAPATELLRYDFIIIPRLAEFALDAHRLLTLLKNRLTPTGVLITAQLNGNYHALLKEIQSGQHRFFDRHLYGQREITNLMYASFFKDVTVLPIGADENLTNSANLQTGDPNRFWLEVCRPHTPIVTALKAGEQYPGENAAITAYLRRMEYDIDTSDLAIDIGAIPTRRLALFIHSVIADQHKDGLLSKLSPFLPEEKLAALRQSLDELAVDDIPDFFDGIDDFEPETVTEIPAPILDGEHHTIAFVTCVNDEARYAECCRYLKAIDMPLGWSARLLPIRGAVSMAAGYETGRQLAKTSDIIVYLHQDVLVVNKNLVSNLIAIFSHSEKIGLVGVIGCRRLPETGIWWDGRRMVGQVLHACEPESIALAEHHEPPPDRFMQGVEAVDGLFIAARGSAFPTDKKEKASPIGEVPEGRRGKSIYDIPWRADLFDGWHFYDSSICREYRRRGLSIVIPRQSENFWCIHCPTEKSLDPAYHRYRQRFLQEYGDELSPEV